MKKLFTAIFSITLLFIPIFGSCSTQIINESIRLASEQLIMDADSILKWNKQNDDIYSAKNLSKETLLAKINAISIIPTSKRYIKISDGLYKEADPAYYSHLINNINFDAINDTPDIRYGFITKRTPLKTFPSKDEAFSTTSSAHDRFLESTLYPFEPVAILHESSDGEWIFIKMYNYEGWVLKDNVAETSIDVLRLYEDNDKFVVISVPKAFTSYSMTELDMGCLFPLVNEHDNYYTVLCPKRDYNGKLCFSFGYISKQNANIGYLQYTQKHILIQAAKFINEPYGWGGMNGYRDCSALVMDIYRSMGIKLKRNTDQQELMSPYSLNVRSLTKDEKENVLIKQPAGSLLFMDGHVMLYLGYIENKPYILHDVTGYYHEGIYVNANKVTVNDLYIENSQGSEYITLLSTFLLISE